MDTNPRYTVETLDEYDDNGTMPENVATLEKIVVGRRIVSAQRETATYPTPWGFEGTDEGLVLTLDDGTRAILVNGSDCCAYTELQEFLLHPESVDHVILGVGTTDGYTTWHVYADMGDVLTMKVGWSCGNPFYYGYGFTIAVLPTVA
jgi:hypothetical protein